VIFKLLRIAHNLSCCSQRSNYELCWSLLLGSQAPRSNPIKARGQGFGAGVTHGVKDSEEEPTHSVNLPLGRVRNPYL
jgi:hypothetical protein